MCDYNKENDVILKKELQDECISANDMIVSATCLMIDDYLKALGDIKGRINTIADLGCGYGGITLLTKKYLKADKAYGIDRDTKKNALSSARGICTFNVDLNHEPIPINDNEVDLVICNGVIEHLAFYDNVLLEAYRILRHDGYFFITMPNLANYIQRISLLLGYQPSDVSVSSKIQVGTLFDAGKETVGHAHSATLGAITQLLNYYNFEVISVRKGKPKVIGTYMYLNPIMKIIGYIVPKTLARRLIIVSQK